MINVHTQVEDEKYFHHKDVEKAVTRALKIASRWLARESLKRIGRKLSIKNTAGKRRVRINKVDKNTGGVWFGLQPLSLAYARNYEQTSSGVQSGDRFYRGAFAQTMSGSRELIWRRVSNRATGGTRKKRSPNGTRRKRKSPTVRIVREDVGEISTVVDERTLLNELQEVFKEAFLNELYK